MAGYATTLDFRRQAAFFPHITASRRTRLGPLPEEAGAAGFNEPISEVEVDQVLADSFPASDPPSWTPAAAGTASTIETPPRDTSRPGAFDAPGPHRPSQPAPAYTAPVIEVSGRMGLTRGLTSLAGAVAVVLAGPLLVALAGWIVMRAWDLF